MKAKLAVLSTLLALFGIQARATVLQTYASASFTDSDGHSAIVVVQRNLLNGYVITEVFYTFCIDSGLTVCQEGSSGPFDQSFVPNSDFTGQVTGNYLKPDMLTLQIDTSTVQEFSNYLCYLPNPYTGGSAPRPPRAA
jgi:hypothetical protein